jgi:hypothetical protein
MTHLIVMRGGRRLKVFSVEDPEMDSCEQHTYFGKLKNASCKYCNRFAG